MSTIIDIIALLKKSPATSEGVSLSLGIHKVTSRKWLKALHKERIIFIAGWLADGIGRDKVPIYAFGEAEDLPKRVLTRSEISRRYRERQEAENGGHTGGQGQEGDQEDPSGQLSLFRDADR
jgi:hypothetical protein